MFAIIYLILFGLVTNNEANWDQDAIDRATIVTQCPYPIQDGRATNFMVINGTAQRIFQPIPPTFDLATGVNGTGSPTSDPNEIVGTRFNCFIQGGTIADTNWLLYQATSFADFPSGWLLFVGDTIQSFFSKFYAYLFLVGQYFLIAINAVFPTPDTEILGNRLGDVGSTTNYILTAISITMIIFIVAMMYKVLSPFTGGGGGD